MVLALRVQVFLASAIIGAALTCVSPAKAEASLVGIWFSAGQPDEDGVMSLIEFKQDGTFREEFRKCEKGEVVGFQMQSGLWTLENGIEKTITDKINGDSVHVEDVYTLEVLTDTQRRVRLMSPDLAFTSIRVQRFEFPDCASGV